jgi:hypothetical protein
LENCFSFDWIRIPISREEQDTEKSNTKEDANEGEPKVMMAHTIANLPAAEGETNSTNALQIHMLHFLFSSIRFK